VIKETDVGGERLREAHSPYLAMHADDPVDWRPWGTEAFDEAANRDVPILLSVGYSSCHWCHVMQRESFRDEETAAYLNERFVCIKVDREERPDVDALYMDYVNATAGHGGWPMTVFLTPQLFPVLGGTYYPKTSRGGMPAFMEILRDVYDTFTTRPDSVEDAAEFARRFLEDQSQPSRALAVEPGVVESAARALAVRADRVHGGFGSAPKFPMFPVLAFLLRFGAAASDMQSDQIARDALRAMIRSGTYDQAGGGLFRYATDDAWLIPHFEKMLYDNAQLLGCLALAHAISSDAEFAYAAGQTAAFLERDMLLDGGLFAAALSAETDGVEGATYVWDYEELAEMLSADHLELAREHLGAEPDGVWEGTNVLTRREGREVHAALVDEVLRELLEARCARPQPNRDDKVLTSWNAMAAHALLEAGAVFEDEVMLDQGRRTLEALLAAVADDGAVAHIIGDPATAGVRLIEDDAHLIAAALSAHEVLSEERYLDTAGELHDAALDTFLEGTTVYMTSDVTDLPVRPRERTDSPTPSGASTLAQNAVRLSEATSDETHAELAEQILSRWVGTAMQASLFAGTALESMLMLMSEET
jgi:uncharacterized protein YyaL (SSP411 family)